MELIVMKLGGSVVTRKDTAPSFNRLLLKRIATELVKIRTQLLLIHGAGSYGHPIAKKYSIHQGYKDRSQLKGITETKRSMLSLTMMITETLAQNNVPVIPFLSSSCMVAEAGRLVQVDLVPFRSMLGLGLVPLCSGDVVADLKMGFSIVSGDQIAVYLAERLGAAKVIFGCDVDGVFDSDPKKDPQASLIKTITLGTLKTQMRFLGKSTATDVTQGMLGKIKESVDYVSRGGEVVIMNLQKPQNLTRLLQGEGIPCTRFVPDPESQGSSGSVLT